MQEDTFYRKRTHSIAQTISVYAPMQEKDKTTESVFQDRQYQVCARCVRKGVTTGRLPVRERSRARVSVHKLAARLLLCTRMHVPNEPMCHMCTFAVSAPGGRSSAQSTDARITKKLHPKPETRNHELRWTQQW